MSYTVIVITALLWLLFIAGADSIYEQGWLAPVLFVLALFTYISKKLSKNINL